MTYAPKYMDRIERLNEIATGVKGEVNLTGKGNTELERDISYKLAMYDEPLYVQVKSLDKVGWAKDMNIIWVKKGEQEDIIEYIEYGKDFNFCTPHIKIPARIKNKYIHIIFLNFLLTSESIYHLPYI